MNKFLKCWVFILCILFILLILFTDRVNAETCFNWYNATVSSNTTNLESNIGIGINRIDKLYDNIITMPNVSSSYFKGQLWYAIKDTNNTITSNINITNWNLSLTCSNTDVITSGGNTWGYISYADGTSATILSNLKGVVCDYYTGQIITQNNTSTITTNWKYEPNITGIGLQYYRTANDLVTCNVDSNGNFTCPIVQDSRSIKGFRFLYTLEKSTSTNIKYGLTSGILQFCDSDTQAIINNNNSNTQTIIQQQQNINNSITSNDVTGNNSSSSITSIGNTFNTQEDFLLNLLTIPYTLWTSILNVFSNSCAPLDVGTMFNYHLVFPCIELNDFLGGIYATIIDVIFTAIIYSAFIRRVIKYFRELLTLDEHALITGGVKLW